ncbi:hypothetical protein C9374_012917 [Naegleria lovaniensis]|uniref:AAA+ ATPase domain-containing protein n=1 Tax=Naegleria lovaniensis TaxID=51637 RepID=A0AA88KE99_NAELO|nr:uncharacterized protein C9374_012917 [Naegleria lovaniensis]KAG2373071.1 hypothetical protein C9374_012917 [Naegleria lovaniensis]
MSSEQVLVEKLFRISAVVALDISSQKTLSFERVLQFMDNNFSFAPFEKVAANYNDDDIFNLLFEGESATWFKYNEQNDQITLVIQLPTFVVPNSQFKNETDLLLHCPTLNLAKAFTMNSKMRRIGKVLRKINKLVSHNRITAKPPINPQASVPNSQKDDVKIVNSSALATEFSNIFVQKTFPKLIGLDCEGVNLGSNGRLSLVQISVNGTQYLFDLQAAKNDKKLSADIINALSNILTNEAVVKVIHDCRNDILALYKSYAIIVKSVMDTRLLYQEITKSTKDISFNELCKIYSIPENPFKEVGKKLHKNGSWCSRPLTDLMIRYSSADVRYLTQLYLTMIHSVPGPMLEKTFKAVLTKVTKLVEGVIKPIPSSSSALFNSVGHMATTSSTTQSIHTKENQSDLSKVPVSNTLQVSGATSTTNTPPPITVSQPTSSNHSFKLEIVNQIYTFLDLFPKRIQEKISKVSGIEVNSLIEVAMDKGRPYELFYYHKQTSFYDPTFIVQQEDIDEITKKLSFGSDNRAGMDGSLHRISAMVNRGGNIIGLTLRVGRAVIGRAKVFSDFIEQGKSVLLLGRPGSGKTTFIRDFARNLSENRRVVVVDTSCEIGGFGDIPHVAIGKARRMQVSDIRKQQEVMIQAVQNHTPEVIVIDEIGTKDEVNTARTIAQRGVVLCGSAHGDMKSILKNPVLCELLGGVESVIMSDRNATSDGEKMRLQLKADPIFDVIIQLPDDPALNEWKIFTDLKSTVQNILAKRPYQMEIRTLDVNSNTLQSSHITVE